MRQQSKVIVIDGDLSDDVESIGVNLDQIYAYSIQVVWTGSPVGNFTLEVSNDIEERQPGDDPGTNVVNWITYTGSTIAAGGADGSWIYNVTPTGYSWVRLKFTSASGTGVLNAILNIKGS